MKTYDIFLFDADGTLFDFDKSEANAIKMAFDYYSFDYSESILQRYKKINEHLWLSHEKGEIALKELSSLRFLRLFNEIGIRCDAAEFNERYLNELGNGRFLINGALEICKEITACNKSIYIVTNGMLATQQARIKYSLIKDYISDYFVSEAIGYKKPHKLYFDYVFSHIPQIDKSKILIIGDSLTADIAGGNNAGIDSCWFNEHGKANYTDNKPTYEIRFLNELNKFI